MQRRSLVNFEGQDIFAQKYVWKKINKMPEFYMIYVQKYFSQMPPTAPVSYAYGIIKLYM